MKQLLPLLLILTLQADDTATKKEFVILNTLTQQTHYEMRYASENNFIGTVITGYEAPLCYLSKEAANALLEVEKELQREGLRLKVYDCYRPQRAVDHFVRWAKALDDTKMKAQYYPKVDKKVLFRDGYIAAKSGHSRGSTLDLTIEGLDMGTPFDFFDPRSHTLSSAVTKKQHSNRLLLKKVMEKYGFKNYAEEWWHYTLRDEPFKNTYFDFIVR